MPAASTHRDAPVDALTPDAGDGRDPYVAVPGDPAPGQPVDGRHARRDRNRTAVVDALLQLYREGNIEPSTDQIAARAGVSARSLFRYFDDVDDLCRIAIGRQHEHIDPIAVARIDPTLPFDQRIREFVQRRVTLYQAMSWVGVVARTREPFQPLIAAELTRVRAFLRRRTAKVFATELTELADADDVLDAIEGLCSFESFRLVLAARDGDAAAAARVMTTGVTRLLHPGGGTP